MANEPDNKADKSATKPASSRSQQDEDVEGHLLLPDDDVSVNSLEKIYEVFAASAKRWEAIVYPSLVAFIVLAVYGFYLIYSLTTDVDRVVQEMKIVSTNMVTISKDITRMTGSVTNMTDSVANMRQVLGQQLGEMQKLNVTITQMNKSFHVMTVTMDQMRRDLSIMNHNVSRPMNFMNSFMPW